MTKSLLLPAFAALLLACSPESPDAPGASAPRNAHPVVIDGDGWSSVRVSYRCADDASLEVSYLYIRDERPEAPANALPRLSFAALHYDGGTHLMQARITASGEAYIAVDEQRSYRWRTKGDVGFLSFMPADHTAEEETVLRDCEALM